MSYFKIQLLVKNECGAQILWIWITCTVAPVQIWITDSNSIKGGEGPGKYRKHPPPPLHPNVCAPAIDYR